MTPLALATRIRAKTHTDTTSYADATMLVDVNLFKNELAGMIQKKRPELFSRAVLQNLTLDTREYDFPTGVMNNIVKLELKFSSSGDYVVVDAVDFKDVNIALQESKIVEAYDNDNPRYFIRNQMIYILSGSIVAVTSGIRITVNEFPSDLANLTGNTTDISVKPSSTTHGFPLEFHELLARRVTIEYKDRENMALSSREQSFQKDLDDLLDNFDSPNLDLKQTMNLPADDSDNGFNL